jgi:hypothetical protein
MAIESVVSALKRERESTVSVDSDELPSKIQQPTASSQRLIYQRTDDSKPQNKLVIGPAGTNH